MGGAEAFIAIVRNGACVAKSLLPPSHTLVASPHGFKAVSALHAALDHLPPIDLLIAPLQLVAVVSGCVGGVVDLGKALRRLGRARRWCQGASQMESQMYGRELAEMRARLSSEYWEAAGAVLDALLRFTFGACFYYFLLSTLRAVDDESIGWTLVAMEAASLICLYRGAASFFRRRARSLALLGTTADELLFDFEVLTERRLVDYADKRLLFTWQDQVAFHRNALVADLEHLARNYERLAHVIQGVRSKRDADAMRDAEETLHRIHQAGRTGLGQAWLEALIWLFDLVAFLGYAAFPLTFFYPDEAPYRAYLGPAYPGHSRVLYHGGLLGDVMWTVQPLAVLGSAFIRAILEETLATGAPAFRIKRPLPAVAGRKRTKSGASSSGAAAPAKAAPAANDTSSSTLKRRTSAAAAVVRSSPVRKASSSTSPSSLASPTTPNTGDGKKRKSGWSPFGQAASIASRTRTSRRTSKKD